MRARAFFTAATASYVLNCALGASVALRLVDTRNFRWVHHAIYITTATLAGAAATSALWAKPRREAVEATVLLAPAAVPLAVIPYAGTHSKRHYAVALSAAPFFLAGLIRSWR
ncbi:hypothetical protein [Herbiconiux sp. L3-i23]|uniref:hypothetical protein n=1 Tax=Herbiconiux sp. L3-i23 TaxID=2905871 RepID=UPI00204874AE|nr:hypothetical protein [Herbiconiux sp. L3-i23]BDI22874.1 hypothetical protein L3i23_16500 [Herbiconiux sp. L3-i23]